MRKLVYLIILFPSLIFSQTVGFKYQAVVRNANGDLLVNQQVSFKTTILSGSAIGTEIYSETHTVGTNGYGVVNLNIGNGTAISGSYSNIDWSSATHFLKTELDITGGSSYQFMGTSQILSVPYSEYAEMSGSSMVDNDTSATNEIQQLSLVGNQLILSNGGSVTLTGTVDLDADPSNELQSLSLSNDTLYLSQGNNVVLPPDSDGDATNELQLLSLSNDTLYLTSGGYVVLPPDSDGDATNEIQVLSLSNDTLYLTSGGYVLLPQEIDADTTNEIQALSLSNDTLYLTDGGYAVLPEEIDADTTNEIQALSLSNDTLYLTNGGFAVLPQEIDSDTTNEIQTLSYSNDTLSISNGNQIKFTNSNFSLEHPDGYKNFTPFFLSAGDTNNSGIQLTSTTWPQLEQFYNREFIVPQGKNLIITTYTSHGSDCEGSSGQGEKYLKINGITIYSGSANTIRNGGYGLQLNKFASSINQPLMLGPGDTLLLIPPHYCYNNKIGTAIVTGYLVDNIVTPTTISPSNFPSSIFTVPNNKVLVILNLYGSSGHINENSYSGSMIFNAYRMNYHIHNGDINDPNYNCYNLNQPLIFDQNKTIYFGLNANGYLMDK